MQTMNVILRGMLLHAPEEAFHSGAALCLRCALHGVLLFV